MAISRTSSLPGAGDGSVSSLREAKAFVSGRIPRAVKLALWSVLLWTALALLFASQIYVVRDGQVSWTQALAWVVPRWYVWGLLTPGIVWLDRRIGAGRTFAERIAWHVPLGLGWIFLSISIRLLIDAFVLPAGPTTVARFFLERVYLDLFVYAVIAGMAIARDYASQTRQREIEAHRLALQTADLERRLVESQLQSLRAQVQPHFLFNALNTISAFTETDPATARDLMERLGDLLRASLRHTSDPFVTLGEELTFLDDYLQIESARFDGRITVAVDAAVDLLDARVPSFVLQPLVENAIRHGVAPRASGGHVHVAATRTRSVLALSVEDNGVGLPSGWRFPRDAGVGLRNLAARLQHLYGRDELVGIAPLAMGGTAVRIELPLTSPSRPVDVTPTEP
jgi:two-component system, LytTR family, sensor kinase